MATTWKDPGKRLRLAEDLNRFAWRLFGLSEPSSNVILSPSNISTALALVYAGAGGRTKDELRAALGYSLPDEALEEAFGDLLAATRPGGVEFRSANRLWVERGYELLEPFLRTSRERFGASVAEIEIERAVDAARSTINDWVAEQTAGRIKDLLPPGCLDPLTRLVVTTAVYFLGAWESPFEEELTQDADFFTASGDVVRLPLMHQMGYLPYAETESVQLVELPYRRHAGGEATADAPGSFESVQPEGRFVMTVILPRRKVRWDDEVQRMAADILPLLSRVPSTEVRLFLPRFRVESQMSLGDALETWGVRQAFSPEEADFTAMSSHPQGLSLSQVLHKAFVEVNEQGTEAAAATAECMLTGLAAEPPPPKEFRADRPFVFVIRDAYTGLIHFIGRYVGPEPRRAGR